ncbi:MAG: 5-formyltetrahydrofolate cyclo-ligase [Campylobacteraceae bacterium]|nr:5-formyltetrahydrofolate cyclo-ligase [Campylobacteraceae bacterium]
MANSRQKTSNKKEEFRKKAKEALKFEAKFSAKSKHYEILRNLKTIIKFTNSKKILIFMPTYYEPNLLLLSKNLAKTHEFYIPFMQDVSFKMVKLRGPFFKSKFGIRETRYQNEFKGRVDLAVVPVIGVDGRGARIGHGKGYYDIFFDRLGYRPIIIFVEIKEMFTEEIVSQSHDIVCDFYLTPRKNYLIRGKYDRDFINLRRQCSGSWRRISNR